MSGVMKNLRQYYLGAKGGLSNIAQPKWALSNIMKCKQSKQ